MTADVETVIRKQRVKIYSKQVEAGLGVFEPPVDDEGDICRCQACGDLAADPSELTTFHLDNAHASVWYCRTCVTMLPIQEQLRGKLRNFQASARINWRTKRGRTR